ncbi:MAG: penicillin acylase family protein [Limisphaerales bacterium]
MEKSRRGTPLALDGRPIVDRYVFDHAEALDLRCFDLILATNTDEALRIGAESGGPVLNLVIGDHAGKVGWTITGWLSRRVGGAGREVVSWADGTNGWDGPLRPDEHPRLGSPQVPRIFSANQRKLGTAAYRRLAPATGNPGARAAQIRDALAGLTNATSADMLAIQLDHRALSLGRWRELLLVTLQHPQAATFFTNDLATIVGYVSDWDGLATADSVGYRLVRAFATATAEYLMEPVTIRASKVIGESTGGIWDGVEHPVWALLEARPPHLLNPRFPSYDQLLLRSADEVVNQLKSVSGADLGRATWGRFANRPIRHPFSRMLPALSRWLDASTEGCAGGPGMPRVHTDGRGAVERLVVSPGHEKEGLFHMPGGQSGHFLSPFYRAGHERG